MQSDYFIIFMKLKGHSGRKVFGLIFSQKILTDLNANFTKFELSTTFLSWGITD